ncbi:MAG: choice-of-anchor D domain-containing protein [Candidatus Kapaibacterium sp.]
MIAVKHILMLAAAIAMIALAACKSPTDVQANRVSNNQKPIEIQPGTIDFGVVNVNNFYLQKIIIKNITMGELEITEFHAESGNAEIQLRDSLPFTLEPRDYIGDTDTLLLLFKAVSPGDISQQIYFNDLTSLKYNVKASAPPVFISDLNFGQRKVNNLHIQAINIYNHTGMEVRIDDIGMNNDYSNFKVETDFPFIINSNSPKQMFVSFKPGEAGNYAATFRFNVVAGGSESIQISSDISAIAVE